MGYDDDFLVFSMCIFDLIVCKLYLHIDLLKITKMKNIFHENTTDCPIKFWFWSRDYVKKKNHQL